jgi:hypothetical protein
MKPTEKIESALKKMNFKAGAEMRKQILDDAMKTHEQSKPQPAFEKPDIWRTIMKNRAGKLAAAAAIIVVIVSISFMERFNQPAWAIEQTIEALKNYKGIYISGTVVSEGREINLEMWGRSADSDFATDKLLVKLADGSIIQVKDDMTFTYIRPLNTVFVDDAKTAGFSTMFGPQFYELVENAPEFKIDYAQDPETGRKTAVLTGSYVDIHGPQSWIITLDLESKLPVSMKKWDGFDRTGRPDFDTHKIQYFDDLNDSVFEAQIPQGAKYADNPLTVQEQNIALLSHPKYGITSQGKSYKQASKEIVEMIYKAVITDDLATFKKLSPLSDTLSDEFVRNGLLRFGKDNPITELVSVGDICKWGSSSLGPLVVVPVEIRTKDGSLWRNKIIVQFRQTADKSSCVIYGPYGFPSKEK